MLNGGKMGMCRLEGEQYQKHVKEMKRCSDVTQKSGASCCAEPPAIKFGGCTGYRFCGTCMDIALLHDMQEEFPVSSLAQRTGPAASPL